MPGCHMPMRFPWPSPGVSTSPIVLVVVVVLVLDLDSYWLGEREAGCRAQRRISGDRNCQPIKRIENENEDEHD
jgi:hypothetical protein